MEGTRERSRWLTIQGSPLPHQEGTKRLRKKSALNATGKALLIKALRMKGAA
jgi:hypothetical protein